MKIHLADSERRICGVFLLLKKTGGIAMKRVDLHTFSGIGWKPFTGTGGGGSKG